MANHENQVVLITGGGSGIGKATAMKLAAKGVTVVITGRREDVGAAAVKEIQGVARDGARVRFVRSDVTDESAVKRVVDGVVSEFGHLDMAVNNAGVSNETGTVVQSSSKNYRQMVETNILGVYYLLKYEIAQMQKQGKGAIVNLALDRRPEWHPLRGAVRLDQARRRRFDEVRGARPRGRRRSRQRGRAGRHQDGYHREGARGRRPELQRGEHQRDAPDEAPRPARGDRERHRLLAVR